MAYLSSEMADDSAYIYNNRLSIHHSFLISIHREDAQFREDLFGEVAEQVRTSTRNSSSETQCFEPIDLTTYCLHQPGLMRRHGAPIQFEGVSAVTSKTQPKGIITPLMENWSS